MRVSGHAQTISSHLQQPENAAVILVVVAQIRPA
jgi:hypothetical protein